MQQIPEYQLIRSRRRSIGMQIIPGGKVIIRAPYLIPQFIIRKFIMDHIDWIIKNQQKLQKIPSFKTQKFQERSELLFLGKYYPLHIGKFKEINLTNKLNIPDFLMFRIKQELKEWYIRQAKTIITNRTVYYAQEMQTSYKKIVFSDTTSKWGSCSRDNLIQFSWRLIMAPILVLDYVVVHELAHTKHKHHQRDFWTEVKIYKPACKQYIKWLRDNSHRVHTII
jgi:predicted metal-dependent hydrolase